MKTGSGSSQTAARDTAGEALFNPGPFRQNHMWWNVKKLLLYFCWRIDELDNTNVCPKKVKEMLAGKGESSKQSPRALFRNSKKKE